jgi:hypothetical protein
MLNLPLNTANKIQIYIPKCTQTERKALLCKLRDRYSEFENAEDHHIDFISGFRLEKSFTINYRPYLYLSPVPFHGSCSLGTQSSDIHIKTLLKSPKLRRKHA